MSVCFVSITGSSGVQGPQRGKPHQHRDRQADRRPQRAGEGGARLPLSGSVQVSLARPLFGGGGSASLVSLNPAEGRSREYKRYHSAAARHLQMRLGWRGLVVLGFAKGANY